MKRNAYEMSMLFDCYGKTLTEKQRALFDLYYNQDLSLSEIAEEAGISRQGVHDVISRAEDALLELEDALGFAESTRRVHTLAAEILAQTEALPDGAPARRIAALAEQLSDL